MEADRRAQSEIYVVADDDCLVEASPVLPRMLSLMKDYPEFAVLSLWPRNCSIQPWTPSDYQPVHDGHVMEHVSVGGIRFCRKGLIPTDRWPPTIDAGYDRVQADVIRSLGGRVGYARQLEYNHVGEGYSTVWS